MIRMTTEPRLVYDLMARAVALQCLLVVLDFLAHQAHRNTVLQILLQLEMQGLTNARRLNPLHVHSPVLLMKYAKNNMHRRFYIFIILKTEFSAKAVFHKVWCSLFVENRHRRAVLFVQNGKRAHNVRPYGKKDSLPLPFFGAVAALRFSPD